MFNIDTKTIEKEEAGVWTEYRGSEFLIAHGNRPGFQRLFAKLQLPYRKDIEKRRLDPEIQVDIMAKALSKEILLDWRNVVDKFGDEVPFSHEAAFKAIRNNSDFRDFIVEFSTDLTNYLEEEKSELGKSVETSSTGQPSSDQEKSS